MKSKFLTTYGIEFSYLVPEQFDKKMINRLDMTDRYVEIFQEEFERKFRGQKFNHLEIHDDDVIEISGPYFSDYKEMRKFYKGIAEIADKHSMPTHREDSGGGGGHIHAGIPKNLTGDQLLLFVANVFRDINNRPYLNYIFNEACDDWNAYHMAYKYDFSLRGGYHSRGYMNPKVNTFKKLKERYLTYTRHGCYGQDADLMKTVRILRAFSGDEVYMNAQTGYQTLEFRIFDAVYSEKQLKSHVNFLNEYLKYIMAITKRGELVQVKFKNAKEAKAMCNSYRNPVKTRREFKALLEDLNLSYDDYKPLFKRNYLERVGFGLQIKFN